MAQKIKKGDTVVVQTGKRVDKGKRGEVIKVIPRESRIVIRGINVRKKHQKQSQSRGKTLAPGIIEFEAPMAVSNVMLICPKCDEPSRVGFLREDDGTVHRTCKSCNEEID